MATNYDLVQSIMSALAKLQNLEIPADLNADLAEIESNIWSVVETIEER